MQPRTVRKFWLLVCALCACHISLISAQDEQPGLEEQNNMESLLRQMYLDELSHEEDGPEVYGDDDLAKRGRMFVGKRLQALSAADDLSAGGALIAPGDDKRARMFVGKKSDYHLGPLTEEELNHARAFIAKRYQGVRPVRRLFIGKRANDEDDEEKRGRMFVGKRTDDEEKRARMFVGKRMDDEDKRARMFVGKRDDDKRARMFVGKREDDKRGRMFVGKREDDKRGRMFVGKREDDKRARMFVGKREDEDKRARMFVGKREDEKRARMFVGKRGRMFVGKRRLFIGKRPFGEADIADIYDAEKRAQEEWGDLADEDKRARMFVGKRFYDDALQDDLDLDEAKRARMFVGKRQRVFVGKRDFKRSTPAETRQTSGPPAGVASNNSILSEATSETDTGASGTKSDPSNSDNDISNSVSKAKQSTSKQQKLRNPGQS